MGWFSAEISTMKDLFLHGLQDIYYAEHQIEKSLPDMVSKASDASSRKVSRCTSADQGPDQAARSRLQAAQGEAEGTKCPAIDGIIDEAKEIAGEIDDKVVLNAALIAAAQAVEHYEITRYGTLTAWAKSMGRSDVAKLLHANLNEEKATDKKLNTFAKPKVNKKAIARKQKKPTRAEREAMMQATVGIPAI